VTRVCAPDSLRAEADSLADRILALDDTGARRCESFFQTAEERSLEHNFRCATETLTVVARLSFSTFTQAGRCGIGPFLRLKNMRPTTARRTYFPGSSRHSLLHQARDAPFPPLLQA
jgi:hypothetical protein